MKPLVKECIKESLLEEGLLSNVVSEVAKGMQGNVIVEAKQKQSNDLFNEDLHTKRKSEETKIKMREHRERLMSSINAGAYNGVDLFAGTQPLNERRSSSMSPHGSKPLDGIAPNDPGVNLGALGINPNIWKKLAGW